MTECPKCGDHLFYRGKARRMCMNTRCERYGVDVDLDGNLPSSDPTEQKLDEADSLFDKLDR